MVIDRSEIEKARERLAHYLTPTPVVRSKHFSSSLNADIYFKLETLQPTHSFKVRGAFNAVLALPEKQREKGVTTASGGNHGLGVALACATLGLSATVYLPIGTREIKVEAIKGLGAQVVMYGDVWDEANERAINDAAEQGKVYIHPFNDVKVMAGQATIVCELLDQLGDIDLIVASIGGGGLISGVLSAVKHFSPRTRVVGVETEGADCMYQSVRAGHIVELDRITSICESLGAKRTEQFQFDVVSQNCDQLFVVSDREAVQSVLEILEEEKIVVEPAAACAIAALRTNQVIRSAGERVVVIMCGANVSTARLVEWYTTRCGD